MDTIPVRMDKRFLILPVSKAKQNFVRQPSSSIFGLWSEKMHSPILIYL